MQIIASHENEFGGRHELAWCWEGGEVVYLERFVNRLGRVDQYRCQNRQWAAGRLWRIRKEARDDRRRQMIRERNKPVAACDR